MNRNRILGACLAMALLLVMLAAPAMAKVVSPAKEFYYLDQADVLSEATEGEIFFSNQLLEEACGAQMVVVTLNTTGSTSIDEYATQLLKEWGVGDSKKQNGFVLLLAIKDDDYYAVCGSNLQPKFTAGTLKQYFDDYLEDDFAAKRYDAGVKKFFEAAFERIAGTYNANVTTKEGIQAYKAWVAEGTETPLAARPSGTSVDWDARNREEDDSGIGLGVIVFVLALILVILLISRSRKRRRMNYGGTHVTPIIINTPPPQNPIGPQAGPGGHRGNEVPPAPPAGSYRGSDRGHSSFGTGFGLGLGRGTGLFGGSSHSGSSSHSSGSSSSSHSSSGFGSLFGGSSHSGSSRTSGRSFGGSRSFGSARGGGGSTRGGGAGRGRH